MWPWEHAAIGYIAYSLSCRVRNEMPSDGATVAVLVGTQFPDLVDKPLAWGLGLLPAGRTLAHSLLVAVPVCLLVYAVSRRAGRGEVGAAFGLGYLLHLPADVLALVLYGAPLSLDFLLWPVRPVPHSPGPAAHCSPTVAGIVECLAGSAALLDVLFSPLGVVFVLAEGMLLGSGVYLWYRDRCPGLWRG